MADMCCEYALAGITINRVAEGTDRLLISEQNGHILGLDGAPIRAEIDPQGQSDGGIVHPKFFGPRIITFQGEVDIRSVTSPATTAYRSAMNVVERDVRVALEGILNSASTLAWTPSGLTAHSISVTYGLQGGEIQFDGPMLPTERTFTFQLVAAEPTITVA